ncbi:MAG: 3-phosphoshikimate 1-carboxyvinyltransferase, partial [Oscillospiraceae bacterium]|nr:3-phosphoshikimate 1-carboxyvinyltransferase [Oscillospiraceae bacterium]
MIVTIPNSPLRGKIAAPSSKSDLHRKLICAVLSGSPCEIAFSGTLGQDILATIDCLQALGAVIALDGLVIKIAPLKPERIPPRPVLHCRESGSTLRFLLPVAAALCDEFTVDGSGRLPDRPIDTALKILHEHGCFVEGERLPLRVSGRLLGQSFTLPGDVSSQYLSGLLFAVPLLGAGEIRLSTALQSAAYVDMTLRTLNEFGAQYTASDGVYTLKQKSVKEISASMKKFAKLDKPVVPRKICAEGDWSNAAFLLCAGAHSGADVTVTGVLEQSLQGDRAIVKILRSIGAKITQTPDAVRVRGGNLRGITPDVREIPDLVPPLAILMSVAEGESRITGGARLRIKESDRLAAAAQSINTLGGHAQETPDGLIIQGSRQLCGGTADSFNDHRIAMALALAAPWCAEPVTITDAG